MADADGRIATGIGSIWVVTDRKGVVTRIDPDTNQPVAEIHMAGGAAAVLFHDDALWVTSGAARSSRASIRTTTRLSRRIDVGPKPVRLAAADGAVWTLNQGDGSVTRVDTATNKAVVTISVGKDVAAGEIAAGEGSVWISAPGVPLVRIDPRTNKVAQRFSGDGGGAVLAGARIAVARGRIADVAAGSEARGRDAAITLDAGQILISRPNDAGGNSHRNGIGRNVTCHDAAGADHGPAANPHARQDDHVTAEPNPVFNDHRCGLVRLLLHEAARGGAVISVSDVAVRPDHAIAADLEVLVAVEHRVAVHVGSGADCHLPGSRRTIRDD